MKIVNLRLADDGEYTCVATNNAGSAHRNTLIEVQGTKPIVVIDYNLYIVDNNHYNLTSFS